MAKKKEKAMKKKVAARDEARAMAPPTPQGGPEQVLPPQGGPQAPQENKPPSEQVQQYVSNGMELIHSEKTRDNIVKQLKTGDPIQALAQTTFNVIKQLDTSRPNKRPDIVLQGSAPLMEQIIEVGKASGAIPEMSEEDTRKAAGMAVQLYMKNGIQQGTINVNDLKRIVKDTQSAVAQEDGKPFPMQSMEPIINPNVSGGEQVGGKVLPPANQGGPTNVIK